MIYEINEILKILRSGGSGIGSRTGIQSLTMTYTFVKDESLGGTNRMKITAPDGYYFSYISNHSGQNRQVVIMSNDGDYILLTVDEYNKSGIRASECIIENVNNSGDVKTVISQI